MPVVSKHPPAPACAHCTNGYCKHLQAWPSHFFVHLGDETSTQRLSDLIFPFLQLERLIKVYKTTLLFGELLGSLRFIKHNEILYG